MSLALPAPEALAAAVSRRDRLALARALNLLDDRRPAARQCAAAFLDALPPDKLDAGGHLIGITGPPGAGKSSLTAALIQVWRQRGLKVAILAVDPSSPISGGALLGDRLRMHASGADREVFIRSLACRGEFGGLSAEVWPMSLAMLAAFDIVLVETVGVGQKEIDVSKMTDTTCFVAQPASGDSIQFLKAGIMEVPHVIVVNKEDIGMAARKTLSELKIPCGGKWTRKAGRFQLYRLAPRSAAGLISWPMRWSSTGNGCWNTASSPPAASAVRPNGWSSICARNLAVTASACSAARRRCLANWPKRRAARRLPNMNVCASG
ncbi:MAG: hypothetical protein IPP10_04750 [Candidatus Competibacteraceae bacterium]|nr:hypothetical protein [Candidatus Competibacteraceae bacterium]